MNKNKNSLFYYVIPYLIGFYPIFDLYIKNISEVPFKNIYRSLLITFIAISILLILLKFTIKNKYKSIALVSISIFFFFHMGIYSVCPKNKYISKIVRKNGV
jgi:predicted neutral ceramidase superfamily lipid hydrolase